LGRFGLQVGGPGVWLSANSRTCDEAYSLICMGSTKSASLVIDSRRGKRIWVTATPFFPGNEDPDAHCLAERPQGTAGAVALLAHPDRAAADLLDLDADYVTVDGQFVGTGAQIAQGDEILAGIWQAGNGTYPEVPLTELGAVFTGQSDPVLPGTDATTCGDWGDPAGTARIGAFSLVNSDFWSRADSDCATARALYCVEP
jgi:hypothetical protein